VDCEDCGGRRCRRRRERRGSDREGRGAEVTVGDGGDREEEGHGLPAGLLRRAFFGGCAELFGYVVVLRFCVRHMIF
jgi:hypothetical protein